MKFAVKCIIILPCALFAVLRYVNGVVFMAHGFCLSTEHTEDTEKIIVEDYFQDFILDLPIGYFGHDSAKNKFLDLFSALAAPKIRAVGDPQLNPPPEATYCCAFSVRILVKDFIFIHPK